MQRDPVVSKASELLRLGFMPSASEIRNGKVCTLLHSSINSASLMTTPVGPLDCRYSDRGCEAEGRVNVPQMLPASAHIKDTRMECCITDV